MFFSGAGGGAVSLSALPVVGQVWRMGGFSSSLRRLSSCPQRSRESIPQQSSSDSLTTSLSPTHRQTRTFIPRLNLGGWPVRSVPILDALPSPSLALVWSALRTIFRREAAPSRRTAAWVRSSSPSDGRRSSALCSFFWRLSGLWWFPLKQRKCLFSILGKFFSTFF